MLVVANWKAYVEQVSKAKALMASAKRLTGKSDVRIVLAPPAPLLGSFAGTALGGVGLSAQDVSDSTGGATTGETTAALLSGMGIEYVILGHSERRAMGETDALITSKVQHALAHNLTPIVCIGEHERDADALYLQALRRQILNIYNPLTQQERMRIILAYEPIWAIGKSASESIQPHELQEMVLYIQKVLAEYMPGDSAVETSILYGGSVEPGNIRALAGGSDISGFLIGHASVDPVSFRALVKAVS